ncbi:2-hydroxyacid dehydrogenase [Roseateles koreensis]|uniref:2-hydroxyacid dehydrogenase n=1 Tax=Roseateles koreensis TaxID=2987526 RepID=A0ABT5KQX2_9BURK|nr:2-hydroxyacid dehydrogenase [Roseateles koreensis]MDC8785247.1 2-hydroxyacid dehydrogenase [Roseateles koreensis]
MSTRIGLLIVIPLQPVVLQALQQRCDVIYAPKGYADPVLLTVTPGQRASVSVLLSNGSTGASAAQMERWPRLRLIHAFGAGYEGIDVKAACALGIEVSHAPGVNNATVADHALALMLGAARGIAPLDRAVKAGAWLHHRAARPSVNGRSIGLVGMGNIGQQIARRAQGFDMYISYHSRQARVDMPYRYVPSLLQLAQSVDFLMLACPGGPATRHLVNRQVLRALGPEGFLINVARGSVVNTEDLIAALKAGEIAGAALDVLEDEPDVPQALLGMEQVLLTPHISGRSPEAQEAQLRAFESNMAACIAGGIPPNQVPGAGT